MEYKLGEMIACNPTVKLEKGEKYNLVDIDSIQVGTRYVKGKELQTFEGKSGCRFQNGDTVMARITPCLENGKIAQIQCESEKGFGSTELLVFRGIKDKTDSDYVFSLMSTEYIRNLSANSMSGASGRQRADLSFIKNIKWDFPSLSVQQRIASILNNYDKLIQNYQKQIEDLQNIASELYKEWFVRFRFPGHEKATFENGIPVGWKYEKLETYADISTGKCNREDAEEDGLFPLFDRSQEIKKSNSWIKDCEAIIVPGEGTSFIPRYFKGKFNLHQRCYCVEPKQENMGKFLFFLLMLNRHYFLSVATGATVPSLRYNNFANMKFLLPNIDLCFKFNSIADCIFERIVNLQKQYDNLSTQRDYLLPRLMSGKLEVK